MQDLSKLENDLWESADQLRANSKLNAGEYSMPVLGLIFLRHATTRYHLVKAEIEKTLPRRGGKTRSLTSADFQGRAAIFLPEEAQYDYLVALPDSAKVGDAINQAMTLIEAEVDFLKRALPKTYTSFEPDLLRRLLRIFNRDALQTATGDVFGRIYEYFLNKFAMTGAQEGGEFFTPPSLVRTIVNVIEPDHGIVFDPAAGSGGMFVQTGHFLEDRGTTPSTAVTFYAQEKSDTNVNLARMNLAVHGLEGNIQQGNTYYDRRQELVGRCDFVMANPPFNVDGVDPDRIKGDPRLFTVKKIPGIATKTGAVSNANYLWIQYFYSYLNERGRAGFIMAASASDGRHGEQAIRRELIDTGHVDVVIAIGTNFFYTRSLPCTLWFFDKGKPATHRDKVLMIDARNVYRIVSRKIRDFSDEQLANLTAIVWLYRGQTERYLQLVGRYLAQTQAGLAALPGVLTSPDAPLAGLLQDIQTLVHNRTSDENVTEEAITAFCAQLEGLRQEIQAFQSDRDDLLAGMTTIQLTSQPATKPTNQAQHAAREKFALFVPHLRALQKSLATLVRVFNRARDAAEKELNAREQDTWDSKTIRTCLSELEARRDEAIATIKDMLYVFHQVEWLHQRFPDAEYADVPGLCKVVTRDRIHQHDDSLTPGRYVGVAPPELEDDKEFETRMDEIHTELQGLNQEAMELAEVIQSNFAELI